MGYQRPCDAPISSTPQFPLIGTFKGHRKGLGRPRSVEAGVDYACASGTALHAPAAGVIAESKGSTDGATGRLLTLDLNDGRRVRWLHLKQQNLPAVGTRFTRGEVLAFSGSSANGSDFGVGAHVHVTLFPEHQSLFGLDAPTLDFEKFVDGRKRRAGKRMRTVGPNGANGRRDPSTEQAATRTLNPGTVATMKAWRTGEDVQGNAVWFRATGGDWFWSGGFTETSKRGLKNRNPLPAGQARRKAGENGVNGRPDPSTNGPVVKALAPGSSRRFDGWIRGEEVEGNAVWFRAAKSGKWFWSGGFTDAGKDGLADLNE